MLPLTNKCKCEKTRYLESAMKHTPEIKMINIAKLHFDYVKCSVFH